MFHLRLVWDAVVTYQCDVLGTYPLDVITTFLYDSGDVPVRHLGDVPLGRRWVFHLRRHCNVIGTYQKTSLRRRHDVSLPGGINTSKLRNKNLRENMKNILNIFRPFCAVKVIFLRPDSNKSRTGKTGKFFLMCKLGVT